MTLGTYAWAVSYAMRSRVTQQLSRLPQYPVERYPDVSSVTAALQRVQYLADTVENLAPSGIVLPGSIGKRKLDFAKHPSQVAWGIALGSEDHKVRVGDCEDYALFWTVAACKTGQTSEHRLVCVGWTGKDGRASSHMVAQFVWNGALWWAGNWNRAAPVFGGALDGVVKSTQCPATWAVEWLAIPRQDDSVRLTAPRVLA